MIKLKSIRVKTLLIFLPVIIFLLIVLLFSSYYISKNILTKEINSKIENNISELKTSINSKLQLHSRIAETLARTIEVNGNTMSTDDYKNLLKKYVLINSDTLGTGIWYEPNKYKSNLKFFGPYVLKDGNKVQYTEQYMTDDYNYPNQDWYTQCKSSNKISWTVPYYDNSTKLTMVTTTAPFYDNNNNFLGETTADINLSKLQSIVNNLKIGTSGKAFLLSKDGFYIAGVDNSKVMKSNIKNDNKFSTIKKDLLSGKSGSSYYYDGADKKIIYYTSLLYLV
ncbi:PDC sensor domain-containing protein [Clostridium hydrogenum]|uniref:PDC sensor domain-containing protein n=1 Tax=Clostridium hydrogenum TaxID=2855764 RepID=UPI001F23A8AC|nr:cache domain-containing protein [Clostridium hydrogenum]